MTFATVRLVEVPRELYAFSENANRDFAIPAVASEMHRWRQLTILERQCVKLLLKQIELAD